MDGEVEECICVAVLIGASSSQTWRAQRPNGGEHTSINISVGFCTFHERCVTLGGAHDEGLEAWQLPYSLRPP